MVVVTKTATVFDVQSWEEGLRGHPATKWLEQYTKTVIDGRAFDQPHNQWHTPCLTLTRSNGQIDSGRDKAWAGVQEIFAPFAAHMHQPRHGVIYETDNGWIMDGFADVYVNLVGNPSEGEKPKVKDHEFGREWDLVLPGAYVFELVKDKEGFDGIRLNSSKIFSDPTPALGPLIKRGVIKPEMLLG